MTNAKTRILAAVVGALSLSAAGAWAEPADQKIQELEAKVAALEAKQAASSKEMASTIDAVLRDAEKRSQLLATSGDMGAGYDNGFFIRAGDAWVLRPGAQFQFRHIANYRDDVGGDNDEDNDDDQIENGFEISRMTFELGGTAFTRELEYYFNWDSANGSMVLEDAWAKYMFADDWGVRAGQFKVPVFHEENVSEKRQMAVDRSMLNELLGGGFTDRTQGVTLIYGGYNANNPLSAEVGVTDGLQAANTDFQDQSVYFANDDVPNYNFGITGRVEYKVFGDWRSYRDFTASANREDLLVIGAGGDWSQAGDGDVLSGSLDAQWENTTGWGVYVAGLIQDRNDDFPGGDNTDWGALAQVSYLLNPAWEIFGRYDYINYDNDQTTNDDTFHEITLGVNYYLGTNGSAQHRAKITVDLSYLPDGAPRGLSNIGILDRNDGEDEWMLRAQFQLLI